MARRETEPGFAAAFQTGLFLINLKRMAVETAQLSAGRPADGARSAQGASGLMHRCGEGGGLCLAPWDRHPGPSPVFLGCDS